MSTAEASAIAPEVMAEFGEAVRPAAVRIRHQVAIRKTCERMDHVREEIRPQHGTLESGVPAVGDLGNRE